MNPDVSKLSISDEEVKESQFKYFGAAIATVAGCCLLGAATMSTIPEGSETHNVGLMNQKVASVNASGFFMMSGIALMLGGIAMEKMES